MIINIVFFAGSRIHNRSSIVLLLSTLKHLEQKTSEFRSMWILPTLTNCDFQFGLSIDTEWYKSGGQGHPEE